MSKNFFHISHLKSNIIKSITEAFYGLFPTADNSSGENSSPIKLNIAKRPSPDDIIEGEIAVNYLKGHETIFIKNTEDEIIGFLNENEINSLKEILAQAIGEEKNSIDEQNVKIQKIEEKLSITVMYKTYQELKKMRDDGELIPGQLYQMVDYETMTTQPNTKSAKHNFDIILLALSNDTFSDNVKAVRKSDDTYFQDCDLSAWTLKYTIDNDNDKFGWINGDIYRISIEKSNHSVYGIYSFVERNRVLEDGTLITVTKWKKESEYGGTPEYIYTKTDDISIKDKVYDENYDEYGYIYDTETYKGVIYYMKDEYGNEAPYDFKNIVYIEYYNVYVKKTDEEEIITEEEYNNLTDQEKLLYKAKQLEHEFYTFNVLDTSRKISVSDDYSISGKVLDNVIKTYIAVVENEDNEVEVRLLNHIIFSIPRNDIHIKVNSKIIKNTFENDCHNISINPSYILNDDTIYNIFGNNCYNITLGKGCSYNTFGNSCSSNTFGDYCIYNTFGRNCQNNTFNIKCNSNKFGNYCHHNTFGNSCDSNTFGDYCYSNTFGDECYYNIFVSNCSSNTFESECYYNTFGNECCSNTFGNDCHHNTFGNSCDSNTFRNNCYSNTFGNYCSNNTFGIKCPNNTFGNYCYHNTFGNRCESNTFGENVNHITFSKVYMYYNIIENGNQYITITSPLTTSSSNKLMNFTIAQGYNNTNDTEIIIHPSTNDSFKTVYYNSKITIDGVENNQIIVYKSETQVGSEWTNTYDMFGANLVSNFFENGFGVLIFDDKITTISNYAFESSNLTSIKIPNSVTSIGEAAFSECADLTSITIPNSVTSIGWTAFNSCIGLTSVTIGNGVTSIGNNAFSGCRGLTSIVVKSGNSTYDSRDNCNAIIETATNKLIVGCQNTTIPNSVTSIGESAFSGCSGLTSITIPNSVTSIGKQTFYYCIGLTSVTIGNGVTSIGNNAFSGCSGLTSITSLATAAPTITSDTFRNVKTGGTLYIPNGNTGYNVWMSTDNYYLGKYGWNIDIITEPITNPDDES